ncbi:MAG: outer membrane lipoprotein-sorting protein [Deltaproteobacteria bacterium]|nr:outer membrane lipoprotein-sorting protein [Deltaproteobacteria bacterium]
MTATRRWRFGSAIALVGMLLRTSGAAAEPMAPERAVETPTPRELEEILPEGTTLGGREIYDRLFKNRKRLRTVVEVGRILSKDPAGNPQETRFELRAKDYRGPDDQPTEGVFAKVVIILTGPRDIEHTGYLYVHRSDRADDQFLYSPMRKRVARASLRGQNVAGTDFSFDDFLTTLDDLEQATYRRLPDEAVDGAPCYVVEATMLKSSRSRYSRSVAAIEKEHYVPLRTRYWDDVGVAVKELRSPRASLKAFDGVWVPTESTMTDLLEDTHSTVTLQRVDPNPALDDGEFNTAALERR